MAISLGSIFSPLANPTRNIGLVPAVMVADDPAKAREIITSGFPADQTRLVLAGVCRDCYDGNFIPYMSEWIGNDRARDIAVRYSKIMRRTVDVLTTHLYRKGPIREIYGHPEATALLSTIYKASNFDSIMQLADRITHINDAAAIEFVPNTGTDAVTIPVKMRVWDSSEFVPFFTSDNAMEPWAVATLSNFGDNRMARYFSAEEVSKFTSPTPVIQSTTNSATNKNAGMTEVFGYPQPNYLGIVPFEFVSFEMPRNSFWTGGIGQHLAHLNLHVNRRLSDLADQIIHWRPKGVLKNTKADWNLPRDQKPGQYTRLETTGNVDLTGAEASAEFLGPDLGFTQYDWNDLMQYIDHMVEMEGVPASTIRMTQQGGTSGVAIMSEQLPLIERAEARQRTFEYFEQKIAKKCLQIARVQLQSAEIVDDATFQYVATYIQIIDAALADFDANFRMIWPIMTKNRPGPERDAHDAFQFNFNTKSRTTMTSEDLNIPEKEAFAKVQKELYYLAQENMIIAQAQMQQMAMQQQMFPPEEPKEGENEPQSSDSAG